MRFEVCTIAITLNCWGSGSGLGSTFPVCLVIGDGAAGYYNAETTGAEIRIIEKYVRRVQRYCSAFDQCRFAGEQCGTLTPE
jgi:hypothetical protein